MERRMDPRLVALLAITFVINACSGGSRSSGIASMSAGTIPAVQIATGTLTIGRSASDQPNAARKTAYVSPSTRYATLWIDDSLTGTRAACSAGTSSQCTINWSSTSGTHTFTVALDDSTSVAGGGSVLADNSETVTLTSGVNTLPNLTLNGVVAELSFESETSYAAGNAACSAWEFPGANVGLNCVLGSLYVADADGNVISNTTDNAIGNFDNGGMCVGQTNLTGYFYLPTADGEFCYSVIGDPTTTNGNDTLFIATCSPGKSGTFTVRSDAYNVALNLQPQAGEVSPQQLGTYSLVYPSQNYATLNFPTYTCTSGTIS
jgi:hypothetical protein